MDKYKQRYLDNPQANIWVAKTGNVVAGFMAAAKDGGHTIPKLYVTPAAQGKGIGSELLHQAEAWLGTEHDITIGVAEYNEHALQFYAKHGYEPVRIRPDDQTTVPATGQVIREILLVKHSGHQAFG